MPTRPPSRQRPWLPKPTEKKVQEGRKERTSLYDSPLWRKARAHQLQTYPLCRMCEQAGRVTAATVCDHVIPFRIHKDFWDSSNYQSLCAKCHSKKSAKETHQMKKEV